MRIAILCPYSYPSACGVWNRVYNISKELIKRGYDVHVFSSNIIKGTNKKSSNYEVYEGIKIHRFPVRFKFGNALYFNFKKKLLKLKPDIIHTHVYRHPHSTLAPKLSKKLKAKCFLTTHAPFVDKRLRSLLLNLFVWFYDKFLSKKILNSYDKVIAISKWEIPYLRKLGCRKDKIIHIYNGIPKELLKIPIKIRKPKTVLYLGRISPIKNLELILRIANKFKNLNFKIVGPIENGYDFKANLRNVNIIDKIYNLKDEINYLKNSDIFILPSKREAIPTVLLEAMGAGKLVISSYTKGGKELINKDRGFLFENEDSLIKKLNYVIKNYKKLIKIRKNARKFAENLSWDKICKKLERLYR